MKNVHPRISGFPARWLGLHAFMTVSSQKNRNRQGSTVIALLNLLQKGCSTHAEQVRCFAVVARKFI